MLPFWCLVDDCRLTMIGPESFERFVSIIVVVVEIKGSEWLGYLGWREQSYRKNDFEMVKNE